ncbi:DgyrCDS10067 [Dimorphilus gyrociliatus]|nr:DgyrCDS10067 [Dimorphilus gyrociliatus]
MSIARRNIITFKMFNKEEFQSLKNFLETLKGDIIKCSGCGISIRSYKKIFEHTLNIEMNINDNELTTLAKGLYFMSKNVDKPLFIYDDKRINNIPIQNVMIASFGSSGQFLKVGNDVNDIKMLAASGEGGSSFLGLSRLISQMSNLNHLEAIKMATSGDNWKVDLCIKDLHKHFDKLCELEMDSYQIKETTYNYGNYSGSLLSSKFGKVSLDIVDIKDIKTEDVVSSILHSTVSNNTRMMYLAAKTEDIKVAYVCGNFMTYNPIRRICLKTVNQCQGFFKVL